jgi:hypothetical protein
VTTATDLTPPARPAAPPGRLIRAELLKIWTTNSWWIFGIIAIATTALALLINIFSADSQLSFAKEQQGQPIPDFGPPPGVEVEGGPTPQDMEQMRQQYLESIDVARILVNSAANIYTSGQFFGLLFMVILGALVVTNEFFHQTATTTFLTVPHRTYVILSKFAAAILLATGFWLVSTAANLAIGSAYFSLNDYAVPLTDWPVLRSVLMNLLAYLIWAVLGVGLGALIRSQLGATLTGAAFYLLSYPLAFAVFGTIRAYIIEEDWVWNGIVAVPGVASQIMISPEPIEIGFNVNGPAWWVGALVLVGYGLLAGVFGTLIIRKRDIS